jgi:hypothetical protein
MIHFVRTVKIAPGKMPEAMAFAKKLASYLEGNPGIKVDVSVPLAGNPSRISWYSQYRDLAELESTMNKIDADSKYGELVREGATLIMPGTANDTLWRSI